MLETTRGLGSRSFHPLRAQWTCSSSSSRKVAKPVGSLDTSQCAVPVYTRTPVMSEGGGGINIGWRVGGGSSAGKPRVM